jgi:hypothetical protein
LPGAALVAGDLHSLADAQSGHALAGLGRGVHNLGRVVELAGARWAAGGGRFGVAAALLAEGRAAGAGDVAA